jgi:hypothetical protein
MPLNNDQLRALGRVTVQAAILEYYMHILVCALVNPSNINIGFLAFSKDQFGSMQDRAVRLSQEVARDNQQLGERIRQWAGKAKTLQDRRNELLHAIWVMDQPTGTMVAIRASRQHAPKAQTSVDELDSLADEIAGTVGEVSEILQRLL